MVRWDDVGQNSLWLLTKEEFDRLPSGIELESIMGERVVKDKDYIDMDTRVNHIAYGVRDPFNHREKDLFLIFKLIR